MDSDSTIPVFESQYPSHYKFLQVFVNKRHLQIYFLYLKLILPLLVTELQKGGFLFMNNDLISEDYKDFIGKIKNKIRNSQYEAMKVVNQTLISLYW